MTTLSFVLSTRSDFWLVSSMATAPQSVLGGLAISDFFLAWVSSVTRTSFPEGIAAKALGMYSLFVQPLFLWAALTQKLCSGNMGAREAAGSAV